MNLIKITQRKHLDFFINYFNLLDFNNFIKSGYRNFSYLKNIPIIQISHNLIIINILI